MNVVKLSFGTIKVIQNNLAEVIVNQGIVMDDNFIAEYHDFLLSYLKTPFGLLINKKNCYTYTFSAQKKIINLKEIKSIAVVNHTSSALMSTETLLNVSGVTSAKTKSFEDRDEAILWLKNQLT